MEYRWPPPATPPPALKQVYLGASVPTETHKRTGLLWLSPRAWSVPRFRLSVGTTPHPSRAQLHPRKTASDSLGLERSQTLLPLRDRCALSGDRGTLATHQRASSALPRDLSGGGTSAPNPAPSARLTPRLSPASRAGMGVDSATNTVERGSARSALSLGAGPACPRGSDLCLLLPLLSLLHGPLNLGRLSLFPHPGTGQGPDVVLGLRNHSLETISHS